MTDRLDFCHIFITLHLAFLDSLCSESHCVLVATVRLLKKKLCKRRLLQVQSALRQPAEAQCLLLASVGTPNAACPSSLISGKAVKLWIP